MSIWYHGRREAKPPAAPPLRYTVGMSRNTNGRGFSLKDHLFNRAKVRYLAELFVGADATFDAKAFEERVMSKLPELELKARIEWIGECLAERLPTDFERAAVVLHRSLPPPLDPTKTDDDFGDFIFAPLGAYVVKYGRTRAHVKTSLSLLEAITQRFSMEDAIRYFITDFEKETLVALRRWTKHAHYHVRRLVSEGTRPLLPWSGRIALASEKVIPFLDILYADPTRYVTRSVANHVNDIAKRDPALALATLARWQKEGKQEAKEMDWMMRHSLRTLVKEGNSEALALLGYESAPQVRVARFFVSPGSQKIVPGEYLVFSFTLKTSADERLMIDYVIDFQKSGGKRGQKVFKLKQLNVKAGETYEIKKRHLFPKDATTVRLYPGPHSVTLQINGARFARADFHLTETRT